MAVAKLIEISAVSDQSCEDAIKEGIEQASQTVDGIRGAWVSEQKVTVEEGRVVAYRVDMRVTSVLNK